MDSAQQSPVLPACCFAPAAWKGVRSSKRANQVAPAEMVAVEYECGASRPSQGAGKAFQSAEFNHGLERAETPPTVSLDQIVLRNGRGNVLVEKGGPCQLTIEIGERGDGLLPGRPHSGPSPSLSSTECEPIPAGTPLWSALLHQSPSREPLRTSRPEKLDHTAGCSDVGEARGSPLKQLSTIGRAGVVVSSAPSRLRISVPLDQHSAAVHICTPSERKSESSSAGVMSWGGAAGCLQCAASAGALDAMRKYWEQAEQRAREAEAAATRMARKEERLMAQLVSLLKQVELRQVQVEHLSGLVAQQQAAFLALDERYLERLRTEQGLSEEPATSPSAEAVSRGSCDFAEQLDRRELGREGMVLEGLPQVETHTLKARGEKTGRDAREDLATGHSSHQHDVSEGAGGEANVTRRLQRGASLDVWAEPRDVSEDGNVGACCGDDESGADSSFEFDTSPLAVLSASSPEAESEGGSPGIRRKRRGQRKEVEVIVEEMVDACADLESSRGGFGEFFVSPNVPEKGVRNGDKWSCDSPVESERDSGSPNGEALGSGQGPEPEGLMKEGASERDSTGGSGLGRPGDVVLQLVDSDGVDQQGSVMERGDGAALEDQCVEGLQGELGARGTLEIKQESPSCTWAEGRKNGSRTGVGNAGVAFVLEDDVGQRTALGGVEAKRGEKESGIEEMEEFLGLASEPQHVGYGVEEQLQGSAPTEVTDVGNSDNLGQGTGREVMVEGAEASFQLGYAELSRASSYDEKTLRSSWPVTAAGTPQIRGVNGRWVEGKGAESIPSDGRFPEQNGLAYTVDGRSGSGAWGMVPLEIAQEVVVEGFGEEDFDGWRHGSVSESGSASRTSADIFSLEPPLMESFGGEANTDGFAERSSPQGRQGAWGGSPKLVPCSPQGPRANPPSPRVVSPKIVMPTPPVNPRGASPSSPHFASAHEVSKKVVGTAATGRRVGSQGDFGAAAHRLETRAGKLFRRDSLPRRNNTSDPFGLQEAALVPHPPSVAAPARKPSTREKHLAASVGGRKSSDKENDLPKVPTVTLRLEGLGFNRKTGGDFDNGRRVGSDLMQTSGLDLGTEWGLNASDVHSSDVAAPEPPAKPRTTSSRPQFRALRPMAS